MRLLPPAGIASLLLFLLASQATPAGAAPWFRPDAKGPSLSPLRWAAGSTRLAQAPGKAKAKAKTKTKTEAAPRSGNVDEGGACGRDEDCVLGTFCDENQGRCVRVQRPFNALYLYYRSGDRRFTEILGIYWHLSGKDGYRVVFPFYWHFWSPQERTRVFFPFYARAEDDRQKTVSTFVLNFQHRVTPTETNYRFWPLVMWTSYGERGSGLTVLPLFHRAREGTRTATVIPLFLSGYNIDPATGLSQGLVTGIYYWHRHGDFSSRALIPFFYRRTSPERSFTWVLPLIFHRRTGERRTLWVLPFAGYGADRERATAFGLTPPFYYHRWGGDRHVRFYGLPFFHYRRDADRSLFVAGPLYRGAWKGGSSFGLLPILFTRSGADAGHQVVFPVYWHFRSGDRSFTLIGPIYHRRRGPASTTGLFPIAFVHRNRETGTRVGLLLPLFYHDSFDHGLRSRIISPLFLYERDRDAQVRHWGLIIPPFYSRRDPDREIDTLIPLVLRWHNKIYQSTTWVIGPLVLTRDPEGGSQIAFPLFWRFRDAGTGATTSLLFPLAYRHRRPDGSHTNILFPFFYKRRVDGWSAGVLPLVYAGSGAQRRHLVIFPAFWHVKTPRSSTTILGPLYHRRDARGWIGGVAPLIVAGDHDQTRFQVLFPLFWHLHSRNEDYRTVVLGTAFWSRSRKGQAIGLMPLFAAGTRGGIRYQTVLPPLYYRSHDPKTGDGSTVLLSYYGWKRGPVTGHLVLPFFYHRRDASSLRSAILPLFYYRRGPEDRLLVTPIGGFRKQHASGRADAVLGPLVFHRSQTTRGFAVIPLLIHWRRPAEHTSTTVLLPLGVHHRSPSQKALVAFPIFWRFSDQDSRSLVVFPIYWRLQRDDGLRVRVVFPLLWSVRTNQRRVVVAGPAFYDRKPDRTLAGLAPLGVYHRDQQKSTLLTLPFLFYRNRFESRQRTWVVGPVYARSYQRGYSAGLIPLLYHKRTPEQRYTVVAPIFWYSARPAEARRLVVVGPFFERRRGQERALGLAPLFYTSWDNAGSRSLALLPLFYTRREVGRTAFYSLLGGYDRSPLRTQWYGGLYFHRASPSSSIDTVVPLFLRHRNHQKGQTTLLAPPLYYGQWSTGRSFHLFFPLVWRYRRVDSAGTVVFPIVWDFNDRFASRTTVVFPVLLRHRNHQANSTSWVVPPLWIRKRPQAVDAVLFPVLWHFAGERSSTTLGLPLYWDFKRPGRRTTLLAPFWLRLDRPGYRTDIVLNTYYRRDKRGAGYRFLFLPVVDVHRKRPGDIHVDILGGIVGYERVGRNRFMTVIFFTFPIAPSGSSGLSGMGGVRRTAMQP